MHVYATKAFRAMAWTSALLCLSAGSVLAGGRAGPISIDQARALRGGITPGDGPGFPVTIDSTGSGSYRLASNLTVPDEDTSAISIAASNVALDLNGFAILGPVECTGNPLSCDPAGTGDGITGTGTGVTVRNGTVTGMGDDGVALSTSGRVEEVRASENGGTGISVGTAGHVTGCIARANGDDGIVAGSGSKVIGNTVRENGDFGLVLGGTAGYADNVVTGNDSGQGSGGVEIGVNVCGINTVCP